MSAGYGPCPVCMVLVTDVGLHHTGKCLVTQCGHPVEQIPDEERSDVVWTLREYRFK